MKYKKILLIHNSLVFTIFEHQLQHNCVLDVNNNKHIHTWTQKNTITVDSNADHNSAMEHTSQDLCFHWINSLKLSAVLSKAACQNTMASM